jgi:hypothetical protein
MKKLVHYTNATATTICIISAIILKEQAISVYIYLGLFQIAQTFILTLISFYRKRNILETISYWFMVVGFFSLAKIINTNPFLFLLLPMLIALYNCYLTYIYYKKS